MRQSTVLVASLVIATTPRLLEAQARIDTNVVYGMYSGTALLMDVHHPAAPNGYGILLIPGNGWHEPLSFDAEPLKNEVGVRGFLGANVLLENGYTLFSINHRSAPAFRYPAAVEDAQRAVRYIRYHADLYGIDPNRIGAVGHSSGGYLVSLLGVLDGTGGVADDPGPINQESSKVQAVVAMAAPTDLTALATGTGGAAPAELASSFLGTVIAFWREPGAQLKELSLYAAASPSSYASPDDPPFLLVHGDKDDIVPFSQSELFRQVLTEHGVTVELLRMPNGGHGPELAADENAPDHVRATVDWFDRHLRD